jgi:hypothetical protein
VICTRETPFHVCLCLFVCLFVCAHVCMYVRVCVWMGVNMDVLCGQPVIVWRLTCKQKQVHVEDQVCGSQDQAIV